MAGIVWWEVETPAPEEFQRFHEAMWGWEFHPAFADAETTEYWVMVSDGRGIGGLQRGAGSPPAAGTRVYLEVDDLEGVLAVAETLGATVEQTRVALGDGRWFARFRDPAGVSFGLWCESPPAE
jgi:predicted enzyme related to lactoylglutathione lyase